MPERLEVKGYIPFPCHKRHKKIVFNGCHGITSDACPQCGEYALFDLDKMLSVPSKPIRGATSQNLIRMHHMSQ